MVVISRGPADRAVKCLAMGALVLLAACDKPAPVPDVVRPVMSQLVEFAPFWRQARYAGEVRARYETALGFRIAGKIIERPVDVGDTVEPGDLIARLDPQDFQLRLLEAEAGAAASRAELDKAAGDLERYSALLKKRLVSDADYTDYRNAYEVARARLRQAEAELAVTRNQAEYTALRAERTGVVTAVEAEVGQVVAQGQTVVRLALAAQKDVVIAVPENRLDDFRAADDVRISLWADPEASYTGRIREVSPGADSVTRTYRVKIAIVEPGPGVQLGMTATVEVRRRREGDVARLPLTSIYQQGGNPAVWVIAPQTGQVELAAVEVVEYGHDFVLLESGVEPGQRVVTAGVHKLIPGQTVRLLAASAP